MKILRKRRGFSTNSSSSFEWVPPDATDMAGTASASASPAPGTGTGTANPAATNTTATASQTAQPATLPITSPAPALSANNPLFGIGFVGLLICGLFIVEEVIRRLWKKIRGKKHED